MQALSFAYNFDLFSIELTIVVPCMLLYTKGSGTAATNKSIEREGLNGLSIVLLTTNMIVSCRGISTSIIMGGAIQIASSDLLNRKKANLNFKIQDMYMAATQNLFSDLDM